MRALGASRTSLVPGGVLAGPWVRDPLWRRARAVPTLDLRFADNKSLTDSVTGANLVTFTRASSGTYVDSAGVIQTATTDAPRFDHNPTTGESLGLLVEESRTNLLLQSEEFGAWSSNAGTISPDSATSPNGTVTADKLIATNGGPNGQLFQSVTITSGATVTGSVYVKAGGFDRIELVLLSNNNTTPYGRATFDPNTGTIAIGASTSNGGTNAFASVANVGSGWYRCIVTVTYPAVTDAGIRLNILNSDASNGDGVKGVFLWGAQLEAGSFPTSYIPTTTAAVTRSADVASITGTAFSSWYRQDEGTVFADVAVALPSSGGNQFVFRTSDNGYNNSIAWNIQASGFASLATAAGGVFDGVTSSATALTANLPAKFAAGYQANNLALSLSGATPTIDTSATMPTALTRADIGSDHGGFNRVKAGTIRRLAFWPQRLANSTLQSITQ